MLQQKVLINVGVDAFTGANKNDQTFLAVAAYHSQGHLLQWSLRFGRGADVRVQVSHKEVHQIAAVAAVDGHVHSKDFFIGKNPDLMRVHLVMPCQLPDDSLRICSHGLPDLGDGGDSPDSSLTSASGPWREVLAVILQLFYLKNQSPTAPSSPKIWRWC
jgi:hypothetical protein